MSNQMADWTFMVYLAGNNTLSDQTRPDLDEMRSVGSSSRVRVMALLKDGTGQPARRFEVMSDPSAESYDELSELDSGDPQSLLDFVRWSIAIAPARRYVLVIWSHGSGWSVEDIDQIYTAVRGSGSPDEVALSRGVAHTPFIRSLFRPTLAEVLADSSRTYRAVAMDDGSRHSLDTIELRNVMMMVTKDLGRPIDVLGLDACLMTTVEVALELRESVRVLVGSQAEEPGAGWDYRAVLSGLAADPSMGAETLAASIVKTYMAYYDKNPENRPITQSAVLLDRVDGVVEAISHLSQSLISRVSTDWPLIARAQYRSILLSPLFALSDIRSVCESLSHQIKDTDSITRAAADVQTALDPETILREGHSNIDDIGGLSIYFPLPTPPGISPYYADLRFAAKAGWLNFLEAFHGVMQRDH